jgi:hypothetical protein
MMKQEQVTLWEIVVIVSRLDEIARQAPRLARPPRTHRVTGYAIADELFTALGALRIR